GNLTPEGKTNEHRVTIASSAPDDLHIVRLTYTPKKVGPGAVDFTLRASNGDRERISNVWPVGLAASTATQPEPAKGASPVQFRITALKDCIVDRSAFVLIHALNTDSKPMANKLDLVVSS